MDNFSIYFKETKGRDYLFFQNNIRFKINYFLGIDKKSDFVKQSECKLLKLSNGDTIKIIERYNNIFIRLFVNILSIIVCFAAMTTTRKEYDSLLMPLSHNKCKLVLRIISISEGASVVIKRNKKESFFIVEPTNCKIAIIYNGKFKGRLKRAIK